MENWTLATVILLALTLLMALVGTWTARHGKARLILVALFACFVGAVFAGISTLLGRAKPVELEWLQPQLAEVTILNGHIVEDQAIYLTLLWTDDKPRLYQLPWNQRAAEQLFSAMNQAEETGTKVKMRMPFEHSLELEEPVFYAPPQLKLPDKPVPQQALELSAPFHK